MAAKKACKEGAGDTVPEDDHGSTAQSLQSTVDEPGGEPTPRELAILEPAEDLRGATSRVWPRGTPVHEVFNLLHIHRQMSLYAVNIDYRRLSKLRHPDKVRPEAKAAATEDFKYLQQCYCRLKDFIKNGAPLEEDEDVGDNNDNPSRATKATDKAMWSAAENRSQPPTSPPDGITWEKRYEIVYPESVVDFLKYHDARLIGDDEHGSILADLNYLWRAVEKVPGLGHCLRVVVWTGPGPCGLHSRRYTGTSPWPTFPEDEDLRNWLRPVVAKGAHGHGWA
jgi:hypothetical protein